TGGGAARCSRARRRGGRGRPRARGAGRAGVPPVRTPAGMSALTVDGRPAGGVRGRLRMPGDKSISHRALLLAALADGTSTVTGLSSGDDVRHTAAAVTAMGARIDGDRIAGGRDGLHAADATIDVGNPGTGIRVLAGL